MKSKMLSVNQAYALIVQDKSKKIAASSNYSNHEGLESAVFFTARNTGTKSKNKN